MRLSGVYLAMLTLAFAQIVWAIVFQWEGLTGGSNGVLGIWPTPPFNSAWIYYLLVLGLTVLGVLLMRRILFAPFGYAMRAGRDSPLRAEATGIAVLKVHWLAFIIAGSVCGLAGALFAFAKGGISPETIHVARSIDLEVTVYDGELGAITGQSTYTIAPKGFLQVNAVLSALAPGRSFPLSSGPVNVPPVKGTMRRRPCAIVPTSIGWPRVASMR